MTSLGIKNNNAILTFLLNSIILFKEHARVPPERREVKSADYMNLHFMVKRFYDTSVKIIPEAKNIVPEYPK